MQADRNSISGGFADPARDAARAFRAALDAMARPGIIHTMSGSMPPAPLSPAAGALALTLFDMSTGLWLAPSFDTPELRGWISFHTGTPMVPPREAAFAIGHWQELLPLDRFPAGTPEYPDRSATLIVEMHELMAEGARLSGPGIRDHASLSLPEVAAFAGNAGAFPLGIDFFLTAGDRLAALPRTTRVEAA